MEKLLHTIEEYYLQQQPFSVYALPGSNEVTALFQKDRKDYSSRQFLESGFVFAPFDTGARLFIPKSECLVASEEITFEFNAISTISCDVSSSEKKNYTAIVNRAIQHIQDGRAAKIVTSRCKEIDLSKFDLPKLIKKLFALYPSAFRYIWYHPESGLWCGATPEVLIAINGRTFSTMALAGTKIHQPKISPHWSQKEINEQLLVTDALTEKLQRAASVIKVSKVKNHVAGSLVHLRTDFEGVLKKRENNLELLARSLHPTPAVCGTPFEASKRFILENEDYDRKYYTGFLGPTELKTGHSRLFVNLRCMEILENKARLFVGGGVTEDSVAVDEFYETQNKLQTMLQVLQPLL